MENTIKLYGDIGGKIVNPLDRAKEIIQLLLNNLPDRANGEDWEWCWNELYCESQDEVKYARQVGENFIKNET